MTSPVMMGDGYLAVWSDTEPEGRDALIRARLASNNPPRLIQLWNAKRQVIAIYYPDGRRKVLLWLFKPCWSCGACGPCVGPCSCAKCVDPTGYAHWRREHPDEYQAWLNRQYQAAV
jgi:hypothetical protein